MRKVWPRTAVPLLCTLFACTLIAPLCLAKLKVQIAKDARFSAYKTYEWLPPRVLKKTGLEENDDVVSPVIKKAVNAEMPKHGLTLVDHGGDLQVAALAFRDSNPQLEAIIYPGGLDWGFGSPITTVGRYNHTGTLVINLIDVSTKKSAWVALNSDTFDSMDQLESKVNKAVATMFKKYPTKSGR